MRTSAALCFVLLSACNVYDGDTHIAYAVEVSVRDGVVRAERVVCVADCGVLVNPLGIEAQIPADAPHLVLEEIP